MTPQTVNAYYDPSMNSLNVPAGILQPPYFDVSWPAAVNYGATGATIVGHVLRGPPIFGMRAIEFRALVVEAVRHP